MRWWIRMAPDAIVRAFSQPYLAGCSIEEALDVSLGIHSKGHYTTLDLLGEDVRHQAQVIENLDTYRTLMQALAEQAQGQTEQRASISLKLSALTTRHQDPIGAPPHEAVEHCLTLAEHARAHRVQLSIDMEDHPWTDFTLEAVRQLHAQGHAHVGAVLQTRLHRTASDLDTLPKGCRVRLVIGIYNEPRRVAIEDKAVMKKRMLAYAESLLRRGHYVEFATHDERLIDALLSRLKQQNVWDPARFEIQMLYGVPREAMQKRLLSDGVRCRLYVPFALRWHEANAYLRRRLDEYPQMIGMVAQNFLKSV